MMEGNKKKNEILEKNITIKTGDESNSTKDVKQSAELLEIDINMLNEKKENADEQEDEGDEE